MTRLLLALALTQAFFSSISLAAPAEPQKRTKSSSECRCFPGDSCWPSQDEWSQFNKTLGGKLIATIPIASACHDDAFASYNAEECAALQAVWDYPETHIASSSSIMAPFFANMSCDPFTPRSAQCVLGTYVQYSINASCAAEYRKALAFAQEKNIRLVIRNTGHDYYGKSTGAGSIAIWTHHIKDIEISDYESSIYTGKAMKVGAGVQVFEAQAAAHAQGLAVVGGNCPTVGIAGGYTQGGGHGPLASTFGLAADQVLEWEVVTAQGHHLVATPFNNSDLYWALSGGGGGTYGAVLSMTIKAHPDVKVAAANLTFTGAGVSSDVFYGAVRTFLVNLPNIVDTGAVTIWLLADGFFEMQPTTAPGLTKDELQALMNPTLAALSASGIAYNYYINEFPTYLDSYTAMNPPSNVTEYNLGGRLIPRSLVASNSSTTALMNALQSIVESGAVVSGLSVNVSRGDSWGVANSVNPYWRTALFDAVVGIAYDTTNLTANIVSQERLTNILLPELEALTPNGAAYVNEGDFNQPNFQQVFYGDNYAQLEAIKAKYDPNSTFYGLTAVGSEKWEVQSDGRLCKAS